MADEKNWKDMETVRVFKLLLIAMSLIYSVSFASFLILGGPDYSRSLSGQTSLSPITNLSFLGQSVLIALIYFTILYNLYCLLIMIARGESLSIPRIRGGSTASPTGLSPSWPSISPPTSSAASRYPGWGGTFSPRFSARASGPSSSASGSWSSARSSRPRLG